MCIDNYCLLLILLISDSDSLVNIKEISATKYYIRQGFLTLEDKKKKPVSCEGKVWVAFFKSAITSLLVTEAVDSSTFIDPTMIGILVILGLMFIVICVVLQMFAK